MSSRGFDFIAPVYDTLARMVYGKAIVNAQTAYLDQIPKGADVLILGGGTGWILSALHKANPDCRVTYVEASGKMISYARKEVPPGMHVSFSCSDRLSIPEGKFNAVITNFFLDMYAPNTVRDFCSTVRTHLKPNGIWIITDFFDTGLRRHRLLLRIMYHFFRTLCRIEAHTLPNWTEILSNAQFRCRDSRTYYDSFIRGCVYLA